MNRIKTEIEGIRKWFIDHDSYSEEISSKIFEQYETLMRLLNEGKDLGMYLKPVSFESLYELFYEQRGRIQKIKRKDKVLLTAEPERSEEQIYKDVRSLVIIQLVDNDDAIYKNGD